mmetsp:Transcript_20614/g.35033  ORF Transcript_20614/g.35033 Transcript_20614/m.35033 type:complete len:212 (-) Transcript_20614:334-969(-)
MNLCSCRTLMARQESMHARIRFKGVHNSGDCVKLDFKLPNSQNSKTIAICGGRTQIPTNSTMLKWCKEEAIFASATKTSIASSVISGGLESLIATGRFLYRPKYTSDVAPWPTTFSNCKYAKSMVLLPMSVIMFWNVEDAMFRSMVGRNTSTPLSRKSSCTLIPPWLCRPRPRQNFVSASNVRYSTKGNSWQETIEKIVIIHETIYFTWLP